jgi:hypothetical protein
LAHRQNIEMASTGNPCGRFRLCQLAVYESAGVWIDCAGKPCLVLNALFQSGRVRRVMKLLYEEDWVQTEADVVRQGQWLSVRAV